MQKCIQISTRYSKFLWNSSNPAFFDRKVIQSRGQLNLFPSKRKSRDSQNYFGILVYLFRFQMLIDEIIRACLRLVSVSFYEFSRLFLLNPAQNQCPHVPSPDCLSYTYPYKAGFRRAGYSVIPRF